MMHLQPFLPFDPVETSISFARRLSLFHTGRSGSRVLADLGIEPRGFCTGQTELTFALADAAGIDRRALLDSTVRRLTRHLEFRGERWSRAFVRSDGVALCPRCLIEDSAADAPWLAKTRLSWRLRPIQTCTRHHLRLVDFAEGPEFLEIDRILPVADLPRMSEAQTELEPSPLEAFVEHRLKHRDAGEGPWLAGQTIEQATRACEMLGATLERGPQFDEGALSADDWRNAGRIGFAVAVQGEDAVRGALDEIAGRLSTASSKAGARAVYGRFYEWLANKTPVVDWGPIRAVLRDTILNTLPIGEGELLLGEKVDRRRLHSVASLIKHTGLHRQRLGKILVHVGLASDTAWDRMSHRLVFPAQLAEQFCEDLIDAVSLHQLPEIIDCTRTQAESLYHHGVLKPVVDRAAESGIHKLAFSRREVRRFLAILAALPIENASESVGVSLTIATKRTSRSTGEILRLICAAQLPAFRTPGEVGLAKLRIPTSALAPITLLVGAAAVK